MVKILTRLARAGRGARSGRTDDEYAIWQKAPSQDDVAALWEAFHYEAFSRRSWAMTHVT